ncbi:MAG TPA: maleylpyruvate isomerase family mycothiol-dependent enzyme [Streptosporangiaceae bacterium]|nr:maleylpyruvate isomerase family mycothiol-dependent enzyme [Streptosporangiaceae bacterium]
MTVSPEQYYAQIEAGAAAIAALVDDGDLARPIPTCPDWTLRELAIHVGRAHRWAAAITGTRSAEFIPFKSVPDGRFPDDPAQRAPWLTAGAQRAIAAISGAGDDLVWAFGELVPARFWGRRMCHETLVHSADAQLAAGRRPDIDPRVAADAIDEWLTVTSGPLYGRPDPRAAALPPGRVLHVHATDEGLDGAGEWLISHGPDGVAVQPGHGKGDAALTGPAAALLLVLVRRAPADDGAVTLFGDGTLLTRWLAQTSF